MAATGKVIGTVTAVVGEAKATAADGTVRILQVGDQVHSDEVITTSAAGSINVALVNGKTLDCGSDADLALHQGMLDVAVTAAPSTNSDVESIQRAIAAGQDPSQVAAATAAGGAPAAGGAEDGGAHSAVILEQGNSASVVSSGFSTDGDTIAFESPQTEAFPGAIASNGSVPVVVHTDNETAPLPPVFDNSIQASIPAVVESPLADAPAAPEAPVTVVVDTPEETGNAQAPVVVAQPNEPSNEQPTSNEPVVVAQPNEPSNEQPTSEQPIVVVVQPNEPTDEQPTSEQPIVVVQPNEPTDEQPTSEQPIVVVQPNEPTDEQPTSEQPIVVVQPNEPTDEQPGSDEPIVVVQPNEPTDEQPTPEQPIVVVQPNEPTDEQPASDEPIVVVQPNEPTDEQPTGDEPVVVVVDEEDNTPPVTPAETPSEDVPAPASMSYSISANTNQDEQIGRLIFQNGENTFETLVFFGQEGQQKPTAVSLQFDISGETSTVKLQYVDAFAGNSDANTGHTAEKIAIKDFGLTIDGVPTVLAQESDGLNVGIGSKSLQSEGSVKIDMATGQAGDWSFDNPSPVASILDVKELKLDLGDVQETVEVINLEGSAAQELTLSADDVLAVTDGVLHIVGGKEDTLKLDSSWEVVDGDAATAGVQAQPTYFGWVQVTNHDSAATLLVDPDVQIKGANMG